MNQRIKFLELVLSDLVSQRDTLEMELNWTLNDDDKRINHKKVEFTNILGSIVDTNNKIKTLSEYISVLTPKIESSNTEETQNNNK
jgi:peptidoglycan hydrolase CwlO-like protein